jgi:osmotically-inducible protein OsmY
MRYLASCLTIAFALAATACAPTSTSRGTGQVIDDAAITARVNTEITKAEGLGQAMSINVNTYRGKVLLSGFVETSEQKRAAERAASRVAGVTSIENKLEVTTSSGSSTGNEQEKK